MTHASAPDDRARQLEARWAAFIVAVRGIPSRWRAQVPHLTGADVVVLDGLIRETLMELADAAPRGGPAHLNPSPSQHQEET
jgi:hypothetical protein